MLSKIIKNWHNHQTSMCNSLLTTVNNYKKWDSLNKTNVCLTTNFSPYGCIESIPADSARSIMCEGSTTQLTFEQEQRLINARYTSIS